MPFPGRKERERDERIDAHILQAIHATSFGKLLAWKNYVASTTSFPFNAKYSALNGVQPFCGSARVIVIGLAKDDECLSGLQAKVMDGQSSVVVPLELLLPADDTERMQSVLDWHYWVSRGETL